MSVREYHRDNRILIIFQSQIFQSSAEKAETWTAFFGEMSCELFIRAKASYISRINNPRSRIELEKAHIRQAKTSWNLAVNRNRRSKIDCTRQSLNPSELMVFNCKALKVKHRNTTKISKQISQNHYQRFLIHQQ